MKTHGRGVVSHGSDREAALARSGAGPKRVLRLMRSFAALAAFAAGLGAMSLAQSGPSHVARPMPFPEDIPDANQQMRMRQEQDMLKSFDAINQLREERINQATEKLLILARDLKLQMDKAGDHPLPPTVEREAELIELLAHSVERNMTISVGRN